MEDREQGLTQWGQLAIISLGNLPGGVLQGSSLKLSLASLTNTNQTNGIVRFLHLVSYLKQYSISVLHNSYSYSSQSRQTCQSNISYLEAGWDRMERKASDNAA